MQPPTFVLPQRLRFLQPLSGGAFYCHSAAGLFAATVRQFFCCHGVARVLPSLYSQLFVATEQHAALLLLNSKLFTVTAVGVLLPLAAGFFAATEHKPFCFMLLAAADQQDFLLPLSSVHFCYHWVGGFIAASEHWALLLPVSCRVFSCHTAAGLFAAIWAARFFATTEGCPFASTEQQHTFCCH